MTDTTKRKLESQEPEVELKKPKAEPTEEKDQQSLDGKKSEPTDTATETNPTETGTKSSEPESKSSESEPAEKTVESKNEPSTSSETKPTETKATFGGTLFNIKPKVESSAKPVATTHVFGSTSSFGNNSVMESLKNKPSVFDALPSKSEPLSFGSFGSNSKFGNAFQNSLKKKSFLDESNDKEKESSKTPEQFKQVELAPKDVKTGEEDEKSIHSVTAKIFELDLTNIAEGWKERGLGPLHVNQSISDPKRARLVMRSQGLLRVVLNMRLDANTKLLKGLEASLNPGKFLRVTAVSEKGSPVQYLLKFSNETVRNELFDKVEELKLKLKD